MSQQKSRHKRTPTTQKTGPTGWRSRFVSRLILIIIIIGLLFWLVPYLKAVGIKAWENTLSLFGVGLAIPAIAVGMMLWVLWKRRFSLLARQWNLFIGGVILALALWGLLSFFTPEEGILSRASLGGSFGKGIIGDSFVIGSLRVAGLTLLGFIFIAPGKTRRALNAMWHLLTVHPSRPTTHKAASSPAAPSTPEEARQVEQLHQTPELTPILRKHEPILTPSGWRLPPIDILDKVTEVELNKGDIEKRASMIEEALASYGVEAKVAQINVGPAVTQFGVEPGWDRKYRKVVERGQERLEEVAKTRVRVERITALANDLALALAAPSIRIEAPVPGRPVVGIEVPNTTFGSVALRSVVESAAFQKVKARAQLAIALGKGAGGEAVAADLARMPHLLIAGATGSGKTVCLDSIICCLLLHNTPNELKFIMVDPKRVEMVLFNDIPHLAAPVVVDTDKAVKALRWLNREMDNRYRLFADLGVRNIEGYNKDRSPQDTLPYLVLVIDELADLMMAAFDEVEHTLCRLAQLARATGIHLVVATQRPSVDVITGLIKANFPTRISFAVTSQVDSRTILDAVGAEKLLGRGDMLYMPAEASRPKRLQGTFASDAEIERLVQFWRDQGALTAPVNFDQLAQPLSSQVAAPPDPLLEQARQLARESKHISTSFLQRRLRIGYPRAARLMDTLQQEGLGKEVEAKGELR